MLLIFKVQKLVKFANFSAQKFLYFEPLLKKYESRGLYVLHITFIDVYWVKFKWKNASWGVWIGLRPKDDILPPKITEKSQNRGKAWDMKG